MTTIPVASLSETRLAERSAVAAESLRASGRLRLSVRGESMLPSLWPGDVVEIASCSIDEVQPGEIVLAIRDGRFFLHRFLARSAPATFLLRGDSVPTPDVSYSNEALLGRLVSRGFQTQNDRHDHNRPNPPLPLRPWTRSIGWLLCHCGPARSLALRLHARRQQAPSTDALRPMDLEAS